MLAEQFSIHVNRESIIFLILQACTLLSFLAYTK